MPYKNGNGGYGQEAYDPETGQYVENGSGSKGFIGDPGSFTKESIKPTRRFNIEEIGKRITEMDDNRIKDLFNVLNKHHENRKKEDYNMSPFNKKDREFSLMEDILSVNQLHKQGDWAHSNNCQRCAPTFVARVAWGYDVRANTAETSRGNYYYGREDDINPWSVRNFLSSLYEGREPSYGYISWQDFDSYMNTLPDRAIVQVGVQGHTFPIMRINGRNYCIEPQAPELYEGKDINEALDEVDKKHRNRFTIDSYMRVDDLKPTRRFWDVCLNREGETQKDKPEGENKNE